MSRNSRDSRRTTRKLPSKNPGRIGKFVNFTEAERGLREDAQRNNCTTEIHESSDGFLVVLLKRLLRW